MFRFISALILGTLLLVPTSVALAEDSKLEVAFDAAKDAADLVDDATLAKKGADVPALLDKAEAKIAEAEAALAGVKDTDVFSRLFRKDVTKATVTTQITGLRKQIAEIRKEMAPKPAPVTPAPVAPTPTAPVTGTPAPAGGTPTTTAAPTTPTPAPAAVVPAAPVAPTVEQNVGAVDANLTQALDRLTAVEGKIAEKDKQLGELGGRVAELEKRAISPEAAAKLASARQKGEQLLERLHKLTAPPAPAAPAVTVPAVPAIPAPAAAK